MPKEGLNVVPIEIDAQKNHLLFTKDGNRNRVASSMYTCDHPRLPRLLHPCSLGLTYNQHTQHHRPNGDAQETCWLLVSKSLCTSLTKPRIPTSPRFGLERGARKTSGYTLRVEMFIVLLVNAPSEQS